MPVRQAAMRFIVARALVPQNKNGERIILRVRRFFHSFAAKSNWAAFFLFHRLLEQINLVFNRSQTRAPEIGLANVETETRGE